MKKGLFIVLDGNDGSGKATQSKLLAERLVREGIATEQIDFPAYDRSVFGTLIGECLAGKHGDFLNLDPKIASSLYALDRFESASKIRSLLESGVSVIADRYASSNQIHQGGKIANAAEREAFLAWLDHVEYGVLNIPRPDRVIYLRVPVEKSLVLLSEKRAQKNESLGERDTDMVEEDRTYLERSSAAAEILLSTQPNWVAIECMGNSDIRTREDIHEEVYATATSLLAG